MNGQRKTKPSVTEGATGWELEWIIDYPMDEEPLYRVRVFCDRKSAQRFATTLDSPRMTLTPFVYEAEFADLPFHPTLNCERVYGDQETFEHS